MSLTTTYTYSTQAETDYRFVHTNIRKCKNLLQVESTYKLIDLFYRKHFDFELRCNLIALLKMKTSHLDNEDKIKRPRIKNYKAISGEGAFLYINDMNRYVEYLENKLK